MKRKEILPRLVILAQEVTGQMVIGVAFSTDILLLPQLILLLLMVLCITLFDYHNCPGNWPGAASSGPNVVIGRHWSADSDGLFECSYSNSSTDHSILGSLSLQENLTILNSFYRWKEHSVHRKNDQGKCQ